MRLMSYGEADACFDRGELALLFPDATTLSASLVVSISLNGRKNSIDYWADS